MRRAGTVSDIAKIRKELEDYVYLGNKGPEVIRACDHNRTQSVLMAREGRAPKPRAGIWWMWSVKSHIGKIMESCENNRADIPYGKISMPGK